MTRNLVKEEVKNTYTVSKTSHFIQWMALITIIVIGIAALAIALVNYFEIREDKVKLINSNYTISSEDIDKILKIKDDSSTYTIRLNTDIENGKIEIFGEGTVNFINIEDPVHIVTYGNGTEGGAGVYDYYGPSDNTKYYLTEANSNFSLTRFRGVMYFEGNNPNIHFYAQTSTVPAAP